MSNGSDVDPSTGYTVSLDVPNGTTVDTIDAGCTDTGETVDCTSSGLASGSSEVFNVSLNVDSDFTDGGTLATSATITDINGDNDATPDDDQSSVSTTVDTVADLSVDKDGPDGIDPNPIVVAGDPDGYDYTLTVSTIGPSDTAFTVSDTLPEGLTFDSGDGCSADGQDVTCTGTMAADDDPQVFTIHVLVDPSVPHASVLENDATVATDNGTDDPNSENNTSGTVSTTITAQADLSPTLTIAGGPFVAGGANFGGSVQVNNGGDSDNTGGFTVNVPLPTDFVLVSGGGCSSVVGGFTCTDSSGLAAGGNKTFSFTLRAKSNVPAATYPLTATVTSTGTVDPNSGNNASSPATNVAVITRANLVMAAGTPTYPAGQTAAYANTDTAQNFVIYEFTLTNNGPSDAQNVQVTNTLDSGMTLVGACAGLSTCTPNQSFPLNVGTLNGNDGSPANESVHIRVQATADASLRGGPTVKADTPAATSTTTDPTPGNNSASENATVWTVPSTPEFPDARPGNGNAFFLWEQADVSATNGGSAIDFFRVTVTGGAAPVSLDVSVSDTCGTNSNKQVFCTEVSPLDNGTTYTFVVSSHNEVGFSTPTTGVTATPSIHASAKQIGNGGTLTQQTGNTAKPTSADKQIMIQAFDSGTTGIGTIIETDGGNFCGNKPCIGQVAKTKLLDPVLGGDGIYVLTLLYDKTLIGGTGLKYAVFYAASDTAPLGERLSTCPSTITAAVVPCSVIKLGSSGANPALKAEIYTKDVDPTAGGGIIRK